MSRALVTEMKVTYGGEVLGDTKRYDLLKFYEDLHLDKEKYDDLLERGISTVNMRKLRANAGDKATSDGSEVALTAIHNNKYSIPLDHPILRDSGVLRALPHTFTFELTLAKADK